MTTRSSIIRAECTKEFVLAADASTLSVRYTIRSEEPGACHFLFKQHLPIAVSPSCRLQMPGGRMQTVDPAFGTMVSGPGPYFWPQAEAVDGASVDMRVVPEPSPTTREFLYLREVPEGWCGVVDQACGASLRLAFDRSVMPYVWLFLSYGGWRGVYAAVLEPCTNMPKDLAQAVQLGQSARLDPGAVFTTTVTVTLGGLDRAEA